ncbi:MAG TPA: LysE family transporter [Elusimicrobiota bacterium]|jgi:threonine/homoserine/homoserine lactone efflux protein|nr:LysE family transporter [Elusimicrobiota bacterium]
MSVGAFPAGVGVGLAIAVPVGPIGILCIRRSLAYGRASGFATGMSAATADLIYGSLAALGAGLIPEAWIGHHGFLRIVGGLLLVGLGAKIVRSHPEEHSPRVGHGSLLADYFSTLLLTMTNPGTLFAFTAIFASLGFTGLAQEPRRLVGLMSGVFLGSTSWWLILSGTVSRLRSRIPPHAVEWINRISGAAIAGFGLLALFS